MKKSFMTRILATGLSFAMAFSMAAVTSVTPASAASKPVLVDAVTGGSGRAVTVNVGEVAKLKVNAATSKTYAVSSVKKSSKKIKTAVNKKGTVVYVRGVAETGEKDSAIRVSFKVKKTGKISKCTFASKVKVVTKEAPEVALAIDSIVQKKASVVEVTFNKELEAVKNTEFAVTRADGVVRTVKSATQSTTDKKVVTVEVYESLTDGKDYTVKYTPSTGDALEKTFTATAGTPAEIALSTATVTANVATEIKYVVKDANGIELSTDKIGSLPNNIELTKKFSAEGTDYLDVNKLLLKEVGNTVELTFKYRTYSYDKDGNEIGSFSSVCKVEAVADTSTIDNFQYGVGTTKPNFDKDTLKDWLALGDTGRKVFFRIKDSNSTDVTSTVGYTVESNNPSIILVAGDVKDGAELTTVKAGTAVLVLKNAKGETVKTLPITVKDQRKLSTFNLSQYSVKIATKAGLNTVAEQSVDVVAKDQYGDDIAVTDLTTSCSDPQKTKVVASDATNTALKIYTTEATNKGDYSYTVKATAKNGDDGTTSIEKKLTVTAVSITDTKASPVLVVKDATDGLVRSTIDTTITKDNKSGNAIEVVLAEKKNGVVIGNYNNSGANTVSAITVKKVGGDIIAQTGAGVKAVTCEAINAGTLDDLYASLSNKANAGSYRSLVATASAFNGTDLITKHLGAGTYRVTYTFYDKTTASVDFNIKDTQEAVSAKVLKTTYDGSSMSDLVNNKDYIVYYVGATAQLDSDGDSVARNAAINKKTYQKNKLTLSTVDVEVKLNLADGTHIYMKAPKVAVNTTFTTANGGDWL